MTDTDVEFTEYVAARQRALVGLAYLLSGDRHAAEDIVQTALARTYLSWNRIRDMNALDAYVRKAVVNEHTSWWRRAWRRVERSSELLPEREPEPGPVVGFEDRHHLWFLVSSLPSRQRAAVVLRYYEGLTEAQTADILDCSVGTVKSQTNRALSTLRARYHATTTRSLVEGTQ